VLLKINGWRFHHAVFQQPQNSLFIRQVFGEKILKKFSIGLGIERLIDEPDEFFQHAFPKEGDRIKLCQDEDQIVQGVLQPMLSEKHLDEGSVLIAIFIGERVRQQFGSLQQIDIAAVDIFDGRQTALP
jgi:hypothetical protein